jgi:4-carboxymuconolactone decarboxylase
MNRLLDTTPEERTPEQTEAFDRVAAGRGRIPTPYKVWIHSPALALGMEQVGTYLNKRSNLTKRQVEMGILMIAGHWGGDYVLHNHKRHAAKAGFDEAQIQALIAGQPIELADEREQAFHDLARTVVSGGKPTDEEFARYERVLGRAAIAETLALLGYYGAVALAMKIHDVPLLDGE